MSSAVQNLLTLTIFGCLSQPEAVDGAFQNIIWTFFFILVDRLSLRTKVFMFIIKQKCKTNVST